MTKIFTNHIPKNLIEHDFYKNYLTESSFRGYYYDTKNKSYGITLEFSKGYSKLNLYAVEETRNLSTVEYKIKSSDISINVIAYDKILITLNQFYTECTLPETFEVRLPEKPQFSLQILTPNSLFIRFSEAEKYSSPIFHFERGLVLARENNYEINRKVAEVTDENGFFQ